MVSEGQVDLGDFSGALDGGFAKLAGILRQPFGKEQTRSVRLDLSTSSSRVFKSCSFKRPKSERGFYSKL